MSLNFVVHSARLWIFAAATLATSIATAEDATALKFARDRKTLMSGIYAGDVLLWDISAARVPADANKEIK